MLIINLDDRQASQSLSRLLQNAQNSQPIMRGLAAELETMTSDNFDSESFGGQAWVRKAFGGGKTLTDTGELRDSITSSASSTTAAIGTNLVYARIHHFGGTIQAKNKPYLAFATPNGFARVKSVDLPSRPFLPVSPNGELQNGGDDRLLEVALAALTDGVR
ncbi:phage virion morphogenesis protein [Moraxella catarrhalis]|uniref:phage virion morphogenesis protein n=1 Tax=Moraxella catarrhalis TaxID=480 RepID=UPI0007E35BA5|nr:phage virion morphogenesis protein [Moraxella catarrhalis]OAV05906.1 Phage capsid and scaffold [Moraxella catarrhalis]OAV09574.1 Phage capsid and scaffold [Moraxella catarrhalis]OAV23659.1 Phage capsid and scaffold [Moraxella catarrhalis]OAV31750.1 Phage capsid and scaffold [Moraxella catarrhalis]RKM24060.1 phage virion morphogenesis protein [Moraxella catarrhalis]